MTESDRERWDRKYSAGEGPAHFQPNPFLTAHAPLLRGGRALDAACGWGGSAMYLAALGYTVDAVDASGVALTRARLEAQRRGLHIHFVQADLGRWRVQPVRYDLVVVFCYLNREFMRCAASGLRPGGLLFQVNRTTRYLQLRPGYSPDYVLAPDELRALAGQAGLDVEIYVGDSLDGDAVAQLIARKPAP